MRLRVGLLALQALMLAAYAWIWFATDAPEPFSIAEWTFLLVPLFAFAAVFLAGLLLKGDPGPRVLRVLARTGTVATGVALGGTIFLIPVWVLGNLFLEI